MLIPSGPIAVDDLANRTAYFLSEGANDGIPFNGSR